MLYCKEILPFLESVMFYVFTPCCVFATDASFSFSAAALELLNILRTASIEKYEQHSCYKMKTQEQSGVDGVKERRVLLCF